MTSSKKKKWMVVLSTFFCFFLLLQQIAVNYRLELSTRKSEIDEEGNDLVVAFEINQLERLWEQADVTDLVTPEKMTNFGYLEEARKNLEQAMIGIQESEKRVQRETGKRRKFLQKVHGYYRHLVSALMNVTDFLLMEKGNYSVEGYEVSFESESSVAKFQELIMQLSELQQEKKELDALILSHNREVEQIRSKKGYQFKQTHERATESKRVR